MKYLGCSNQGHSLSPMSHGGLQVSNLEVTWSTWLLKVGFKNEVGSTHLSLLKNSTLIVSFIVS